MKYQYVTFTREDQPLIDKLRTEGQYVYHLRDDNGIHFTVCERVYVNNIGFVVTDTKLKLPMTDVEFEMKGEQVYNLIHN